jgi:hypothetical protein
MNEAMFDLPDAGFVDQTVTCFTGTSPSGEGVLLLVERRSLPVDMTLRQAVAALAKDAMSRHFGYHVLFEREVEVASRPALDVGARWRTESGEPIYDRRVHLTLGETWLVIIGEAPFAERAFCDAYVDHVLASLQLRE